jgi:hypothetical protein
MKLWKSYVYPGVVAGDGHDGKYLVQPGLEDVRFTASRYSRSAR